MQYALQKYKRELQAMETTFQVNNELAEKELTEEERSVSIVTIYKEVNHIQIDVIHSMVIFYRKPMYPF